MSASYKIQGGIQMIVIGHDRQQNGLSWNLLMQLEGAYLNCCSFLISCSSAWKSIERRATMLLTSSIPANIFNTSFLPALHSWLLSTAAHRAVLTRHGRTGRISLLPNCSNTLTSTFCIAWNTAGLTEIVFFFIFNVFFFSTSWRPPYLQFCSKWN